VPTSVSAVNPFTKGRQQALRRRALRLRGRTVGGQPPAAGAERPNGPGLRRLATGGVVLACALALGGCSFYPTYWANKGATKQGQEVFKIYSGMTTTGIVVGGAVFLLILYTVLRYRRRNDEMPRQFHENVPIEITYTIVPILIVAVLFFFTVLTENNVDANAPVDATLTSTGQPVVQIRVTAFQWGWRFDYPDLNVGVAGETTNGPGGHGPQMVVPVGQTVQITLVSDDVIHGFYVRDFNFSRYALPGVVNRFELDVLHAGTYDGQCTQFCGLYHAEMLFSVRAVSPPAFRAWAAQEVRKGQTLQRGGSGAENNPPPYTSQYPKNP
jgi:cytochrome c oxidase subunit II